MKIISFFKKERVLGVAKETRRYDLPLGQGEGNDFLRLLICLMSILGMLALSASFALQAMTKRWSDGLEGKISVEIPAADSDGNIIKAGIVQSMTDEAAKILSAHPDVSEAKISQEQDVKKLLAPWLGEDFSTESIPLPGLISVTFRKDSKPDMDFLARQIREAAPQAKIDTHESWLNDVLRFTGALQFAAALLTLIIGATTLVAVAGGVRSKLSENKEELELLHLMGASDSYIAKQIQRHTMMLSLQGGFVGVLAGALVLVVVGLIAGKIGVNLIPDFRLSDMQKIMLLLMPLPITLLAMGTARWTVLRVLTKMP